MSTDVTIPGDLNAPSTYFRDHNVQTERLGDGIEGSGFAMVGVKGKEFYLRCRGKRYTLVNPPSNPPTQYDGKVAGYFDFVILRKAERKSHTYYKDYESESKDKPICASTDGIAPDDSIPPYDPVTKLGKQADLCDLCPRHEWKKQDNGRDGRECRDNLRLAVLPMEPQMVALLGEPLHEATMLRVPAASLTALAALGDMMLQRWPNSSYCDYILRITFKKGVEWPQFEYQVVRFLDAAECAFVHQVRETPAAYRILGLTPEGRSLVRAGNGELHAVVDSPRLVAPPQAEVAQKLAAEREQRIAAVRQGQTIEHDAMEVQQAQPVDGGGVPGRTSPQEPVQQTVPDTAAEIDAMIASMRPKPPGG